jgi:PIN domain nuclease of toxin-antitoxin system
VRVLLDSHAVLWFMLNDAKLSRAAMELMADSGNDCLLSPVNHWEIALKISIGKYRLQDDFETMWRDAMDRFPMLSIEPKHTARLLSLPFHHKDPFDRLLIAQALVEQVPLVSGDIVFESYGVKRLW